MFLVSGFVPGWQEIEVNRLAHSPRSWSRVTAELQSAQIWINLEYMKYDDMWLDKTWAEKSSCFSSCLPIFSQIVKKLWQNRKPNHPFWLLLTSYHYRGSSGATTYNILELLHIAMILSVSYLSHSLRKYPSAIKKYHASQKSCFGNVRLMIWKNFFQARKSKKFCKCSFLGLVERSRMIYFILENFMIWPVLPAIVRKKVVTRRFCSGNGRTMIDGSY